MRRFCVLVATVATVVGLATPAYAAQPTFLSTRLTGPVTGFSAAGLASLVPESGCTNIAQHVDASIDVSRTNDPSIQIDLCWPTFDPSLPVNTGLIGKFVLHRSNGTLSGTVAGSVGPEAGGGINEKLTLTVTGGTSHLVAVRGTIQLDFVWFALSLGSPPVIAGQLTGSTTAAVHR